MISHDHNFKNVLIDFPQKALEWLLPDIPTNLGKLCKVVFVRQEPRKRQLTDAHLSLDMPVLYTFENGQVLELPQSGG
jgi:predicted transposase YdaD